MVLDDIPFVTIRATHCVLCGKIIGSNTLFIREPVSVEPQHQYLRPWASFRRCTTTQNLTCNPLCAAVSKQT